MITTTNINKNLPKSEQYDLLLEQILAITFEEKDLIANLSNICALLKYEMGWFWVGFYHVKEDELVLGPFQGPVACTRIKRGKGVCGSSWHRNETIVVANVDLFEGEEGIAPGQACVFYSKNNNGFKVLGGGWITK